MKYILTLSLLTVVSIHAHAQAPLYMPRDVKEAYAKGTRSMDGRPGKNYWQNHGRYNITLTAMPPNRNIKGSETITYFNNSPDTIRSPSIKLFLNIHKPGAVRDQPAQPDYLTSGVHVDECKVNGKKVAWRDNPYSNTNQTLRLPQKLAPRDSVQISFDWHYEISLQSGREGMIDSTTYFIAYFYPRVAVYDDYNGWDRMTFTDGKEFYNDFNDYTVNINVPKNYIVWGTGTLHNIDGLLQPEFAQRFKRSLVSDDIIHVATKDELLSGKVTTQNEINNWQFTANNIPDMAFGISDHFVWDAGSVIVDKATKRRASVQAAYNDTAKDYRRMIEYSKHALDFFSNEWPAVPYPYEKMTIFHGYAGMEYPMMANDETYEDSIISRFVAEHEIAHTYMPFYMGINETRYGFMDEGWATTFELLIGRIDLGTEKAENFYKQFRVDNWISDPSQEEDIAIITPGNNFNGPGIGNNQYGKSSIGYLAMKDLLGDDMFKKCLHEYMDRWNGKHPIPWDFFYTFNDKSGKNLDWFWNNWFFSNNYIDIAIKSAAQKNNGYVLNLENIGGMPAPFDVVVSYTDGTKEIFHQTAAIWEKDNKQTSIKIAAKKPVQSMRDWREVYLWMQTKQIIHGKQIRMKLIRLNSL
ncbi:MAG: M1 family metallopeptidase [Ferruginibacter sp.]